MAIQSRDTINKLGNTMVFFASGIDGISKTKMLKLLYLLEECSVKKYHAPFFGIPFQVWKLGPVAKDVFIDLSNGDPDIFKDYVRLEFDKDNIVIKSVSDFNDDEFSDNDIDILEYVFKQFGNKTGNELIKYTHSDNSAWNKIVHIDTALGEAFELGITNSSDINIDFTYYLSGCSADVYNHILDAKHFLESLE